MAAVDMGGAIAERPREIRDYPFLEAVYEQHDDLIGEHVRDGRVLEVAHGRYAHEDADVAIDIDPRNADGSACQVTIGDARALPFADDSFATVIGRRFIHHVPATDRIGLLQECRRVLKPHGSIVVIEGTPGLYRQFVKGAAFRAGLLGKDTDQYGHLSPGELRFVLEYAGFHVDTLRRLGSPLMPAAIATGEWSRHLASLAKRVGGVRWWTLAVGDEVGPSGGGR